MTTERMSTPEPLPIEQQAQSAAESQAAQQGVLDRVVERTVSLRAQAARFLGVPEERVYEFLRQVWHVSRGEAPLSNAEMAVGLAMIARYQLDPIAREIYVTRTKRGLCTIIGIDGFVKILHRTDDFDGFAQHEEWEGAPPTGKILWVDTEIYSKTRSKPTRYRAYAHEYAKLAGHMHESIPIHMLRLFSLKHAVRLFTPIGGTVVTEEEARWLMRADEEKSEHAGSPAEVADRLAGELARRRGASQES